MAPLVYVRPRESGRREPGTGRAAPEYVFSCKASIHVRVATPDPAGPPPETRRAYGERTRASTSRRPTGPARESHPGATERTGTRSGGPLRSEDPCDPGRRAALCVLRAERRALSNSALESPRAQAARGAGPSFRPHRRPGRLRQGSPRLRPPLPPTLPVSVPVDECCLSSFEREMEGTAFTGQRQVFIFFLLALLTSVSTALSSP